jgi:hypothetical protein
MNLYLIIYGNDREAITFQGDDPDHAAEQFRNWEDAPSESYEQEIKAVYICKPVPLTFNRGDS